MKQELCTMNERNRRESGNVLFLILIAVALFAGLSYAVTQSTRSGSNDSDGEKSLIGSAQITQYPASVRTSIVRMTIGGVDESDLYFNPPSSFDSTSTGANTTAAIEDANNDTTDETRAVFHPKGGGAPYQLAQPDVTATAAQAQWVFSDLWEVLQIGTSVAGSGQGNDLIAFLPNLNAGLCRRINEEFGISVGANDADGDDVPAGPGTVPDVNLHGMVEANAPGFDGAEIAQIGGSFIGQAYGCFDTSDSDSATSGPYVYYHVLLER